MVNEQIDDASRLPDNLSFGDLRCHACSGRSICISGTGRNKVYSYRTGVITDIGDIEISLWQRVTTKLIRDHGEEQLQSLLLDWVTETCPWLHTKNNRLQYALELHTSRIFDNPEWVGYSQFTRNIGIPLHLDMSREQ